MSLNFACIYKLTHIKSKKIYVGKTLCFGKRMGQYRSAFRSKRAYRYAAPWILKLRAKAPTHVIDFDREFKVEVLEEVTEDNINEREIYWIEKLQARNPSIGFNIAKGGDIYENSCSVNPYRIDMTYNKFYLTYALFYVKVIKQKEKEQRRMYNGN